MDVQEYITRILSESSVKREGLHYSEIAKRVLSLDNGGLFTDSNIGELSTDDLEAKVKHVLRKDVKLKSGSLYMLVRNQKTGKDKRGWYKIRPVKLPPKPNEPTESTPSCSVQPIKPKSDNLFLGKAGECAVMSELLFRGYNVNTMMVDDGVDIVASRSNLFYFIQVKTTVLKDNTIRTAIKQSTFDSFIGSQIRYIVVARCCISGIDTNMFFVFNNSDILRLISKGCLLNGETGISIKIKIDENRNPVLYHDKYEEDISFYMNRFDL